MGKWSLLNWHVSQKCGAYYNMRNNQFDYTWVDVINYDNYMAKSSIQKSHLLIKSEHTATSTCKQVFEKLLLLSTNGMWDLKEQMTTLTVAC